MEQYQADLIHLVVRDIYTGCVVKLQDILYIKISLLNDIYVMNLQIPLVV